MEKFLGYVKGICQGMSSCSEDSYLWIEIYIYIKLPEATDEDWNFLSSYLLLERFSSLNLCVNILKTSISKLVLI